MISIIIPTFNRLHSIKYTIESIKRQTYLNWELLVIDDCSSDDTGIYFKNIIDCRIRYFRTNTKLGSAMARNFGINLAKGDILLMMDDDIWLEKKFLEEINNTMSISYDCVCFRRKFIKDICFDNYDFNQSLSYFIEKEMETKKDSKIIYDSMPFVYREWLGEIFEYCNPGTYKKVQACGQVFAFKRNVINTIGVYNLYKVYREETDIQLRINSAGFILVFNPNSFYFDYSFKKRIGGQKMNILKYEYYVIKDNYRFVKKFYCDTASIHMISFIIYRFFYNRPNQLINWLWRGIAEKNRKKSFSNIKKIILMKYY